MRCLEEDTVQAFVEARLPAGALAEVEAHARGCAGCQELLTAALMLPGLARTAATQYIRRAGRVGLVTQPMRNAAASAPGNSAALAVGTSIDRYTVLGLVGRGGMGEVYAAYDPSLDRRVALKLMGSGAVEREQSGQERLLREARAIARLAHPNVVVVYEVGTYRGRVFISMEFVEGMTLAAWLEARPRTWQEVIGVFVQAARGLAASHAAGLVHRDFKPQNVMVRRDGTACVMDFGLARRAEDAPPASGSHGGSTAVGVAIPPGMTLTETGEQIGTPLFMAPEQFTNGPIDARTDQFSFCVALYWALFEVHPFGGVSAANLVATGARRSLVLPKSRAMPPASLRAALARGLSVSSSERWPSMDVLAAKLSEDPARRRRLVSVAAAAAIACIAVGATSGVVAGAKRSRCSGGDERLLGVWESVDAGAAPGARRVAVRASIMRSGISDAAEIWSRVSSLLDVHAAKWKAMYRDACEATYVRGEQSDEALDLRMTCLNDDRESIQAVTALLMKEERSVIEHGVEVVGSLGDLQRCAAIDQLRSAPRLPKDPVLRREVGELRQRLKEGEALRNAENLDSAIALADAVSSRAEAMRYRPLQAEALFLKGLAMTWSASAPGEKVLEQALVVAESCGHDRIVAAAASVLMYESIFDPHSGRRWVDLARSVLSRIGGDRQIESWVEQGMGAIAWEQHRWDEATQHFAKAVTLKEQVFGHDHVDVAKSLSNLALALSKQGKHEEARVAIDEALEIERRRLVGDAPTVIHSLGLKAEILSDVGEVGQAIDLYRKATGLAKKFAQGAPLWKAANIELFVSRANIGLAEATLALGQFAEAAELAEQSVRQLVDAGGGDWLGLAEARFALAKALARQPGHSTRARTLAQQSISAFASREGFDVRRQEVEQWLASTSRQIRDHHPMARVD